MDHRGFWLPLSVSAIVSLAVIPAAGQAQTAATPKATNAAGAGIAATSSTPSNTAWGEPDLQGIWTFKTITPLERPTQFAGKEFLTDREAVELERQAEKANTEEERPADRARDVAGAYNNFWFDRGSNVVKSHRSSLVVDPPDGRVPAVTPGAQKRLDGRAVARNRPAYGPEDRSQFERCVSRGLPRLPGGYNQNLQILQTPGYVVILYEMMREARIIPVDGRPHVGESIRQWMGDSRGRWEGKTLVVETTNFNRQHEFRGATENLRLVERFTRADSGTIDYQFTADDGATWTKAWTASIPLARTDDVMYEYACHEGNYGMPNLLSSARAEDKAAEGSLKK